jgi:hypothetical protein
MTNGEFENGAITVVGWPWRENEDPRIAIRMTGLPQGPVQIAAGEYRHAVGAEDRARMTAVQLAAHTAFLLGLGVTPEQVVVYDHTAGPEPDGQGQAGQITAAGDWSAGVPEFTAHALAGQLGMQIDLTRRWLRDPRRIVQTWLQAAQSLARIPLHDTEEPTAYLFGEAVAPTGWAERAVHVDHLYAHTGAWLEDHWAAVDAIAVHLLDHGRAEPQDLDSLLLRPGRMIGPIAPDHPLRQSTAIASQAVDAAARWWSGQLRRRLSHRDPSAGADGTLPQVPEPPHAGQRVLGEQDFTDFEAALARAILTSIERRTPRGGGGLEQRGGFDEPVYTVGMDNYDTSPVLGAALEAIGLRSGALYAHRAGQVELSPRGAILVPDDHAEREQLWTSPYALGRDAEAP